jgi:large subunit ribosomal protein L18
MKKSAIKYQKRERRHRRIRAKVSGTPEMPRLSVYKSNKYLYAQIVDDTKGHTIASMNTASIKGKTMLEKSHAAGKELAKLAGAHTIKKVVFDRGGFIYTGQVKALAEGAREGGLIF